jgi:hypothetical protein
MEGSHMISWIFVRLGFELWDVRRQLRQHRRPMWIMIDRVIQQLCQVWQMQGFQETKFGLLVVTGEKGT